MVAGTSYLPDPDRYESYVFARYFPVWGWASWSRAWSAYDFRMAGWQRMKASGGLDGVLGSRGLERWLSGAFDAVQGGTVDTWDFQWVHALLRQNALCAIPRVNLVTNIGLEGTRGAGSTVGMPSQELVPPFVEPPTFLPDVAYESRLYEEFLRAPRGRQLREQTITRVRRVLRA
jgi:hypothetical protein